jgi:branched-subunit amino acid aminotransferase/4-amino-4-deoxychorismate lyase
VILVDGVESPPVVSLYSGAVLRGDGCFETLRAYQGQPFELEAHLDRLQQSADQLHLPLPPREEVAGWVTAVSAAGGDCAVRVIALRGSAVPGIEADPSCVVFDHPVPATPGDLSLLPIRAPWHSGGERWELAGAKTLSYAPNESASRRARQEGYHDALLVSREGWILEGPTFAVAWVYGERLETPALELAILDSITRRVMLDDTRAAGVVVVEDKFEVERLEAASEVMALSTIKEISPVRRVGQCHYPPGPIGRLMADSYRQRVHKMLQGNDGR